MGKDIENTNMPWAFAKNNMRSKAKGRNKPEPLGFPIAHQLTNALTPGNIVVVHGPGGSGKSLYVLQCAFAWQERKIPWAIYELEEGEAWHMERALAMRAKDSELLDADAMEKNPGKLELAIEKHGKWLEKFAENVHSPNDMPSYKTVLEWMERQANLGRRVLVVDPISMADTAGVRIRDADKELISDTSRIAREHNLTVVFVHHPRNTQGHNVKDMGNIAGGKCWGRFAQTVMYIERTEVGSARCKNYHGALESCDVNRILTIQKCRHGRGAGIALGYQWHPDRFQFYEQGEIHAD